MTAATHIAAMVVTLSAPCAVLLLLALTRDGRSCKCGAPLIFGICSGSASILSAVLALVLGLAYLEVFRG